MTSKNPFNTTEEIIAIAFESVKDAPNKKLVRKAYTRLVLKSLGQGVIIAAGSALLIAVGAVVATALTESTEEEN